MKPTATTLALLLAGTTTAFAQDAVQDATLADADGDGLVSLAELQDLYTDVSPADMEAGFAQVDIDGDGLLNDDEIALARESGIFPPTG